MADPWLSHALFTSDAAPDTSCQAPAEPSCICYSLLSLRSVPAVSRPAKPQQVLHSPRCCAFPVTHCAPSDTLPVSLNPASQPTPNTLQDPCNGHSAQSATFTARTAPHPTPAPHQAPAAVRWYAAKPKPKAGGKDAGAAPPALSAFAGKFPRMGDPRITVARMRNPKVCVVSHFVCGITPACCA